MQYLSQGGIKMEIVAFIADAVEAFASKQEMALAGGAR